MSRRALRGWARQQRRLVVLLRARHPLIRRTLPGHLILETLGLAPHPVGKHSLRDHRWLPPHVQPEIPEEWQAEPEEMETPAARERAPAQQVGQPEEPLESAPSPSAMHPPTERPRHELPANWTTPASQPRESSTPQAATPPQIEPLEVRPARPADVPVAEQTAGAAPAASSPPVPEQRTGHLESGDGTRPESAAPDRTAPSDRPVVGSPPPGSAARPAEETVRRPPVTPAAHSTASSPADVRAEPSTTEATPGKPPERSAETQPSWQAPEPDAVEAVDASSTVSQGEQPALLISRAAAPSDSEPPPVQQQSEDKEQASELHPVEAPPVTTEAQPRGAGSATEELHTENAETARPVSAPRVIEERRARRPAAWGTSRPGAAETGSRTESGEAQPPIASPPTVAEEKLFAGVENRPIDEWRRLLIEATTDTPIPRHRPESPRQPEPPTKARPRPPSSPVSHEPVSETTRRFLRPLVGIDPCTVRVRRGADAQRAVGAAGAEALAVGEEIALPSAHDERSPEGLGLLAHELTHVALRRDPRFVPPIASGPLAREKVHPGGIRPRSGHREDSSIDEEQLARRVEGRVRAEARDQDSDSPASEWPVDRETSAPAIGSPESGWTPPAAPTSYTATGDQTVPPWGDLPAPWEPLPQVVTEAGGGTAGSNGAATSAPVAVHRATPDRTFEEPQPAAASATKESAPAPDLDALARQVYDALRRRLAAERRREG